MKVSSRMTLRVILLTSLMLWSMGPMSVQAADAAAAYAVQRWTNATATWYGGTDGSGTMGGACGYGNMYARGYGLATAALSSQLFNGGLTCGACFELKCRLSESRWCYRNVSSITVTATNFCPENRERTKDGWCNGERLHFDLTNKMFTTLAQYVAGIIPVKYRRTPCIKQGGIRVTLNGNPHFNLILFHNVGGSGNIVSVQIKGLKSGWSAMTQNWGELWDCGNKLVGQGLSFRVGTGFGQTFTFWNVAPTNWTFGQSYEASSNVNDSWTLDDGPGVTLKNGTQ